MTRSAVPRFGGLCPIRWWWTTRESGETLRRSRARSRGARIDQDRIVSEVTPRLVPKTWYGFPSYADDDGKVVVFFKAASKFTTRYATLGFEESARLDDGDLWVTSFALLALTPATERTIAEYVRKEAG